MNYTNIRGYLPLAKGEFIYQCLPIFYMNGTPSQGQIAMAAGDYWIGLKDMWGDALTNPQYYLYLAHVFVGTATNLQGVNSTSTTYNGKISYSNATNPQSNVVNIKINNRTYIQYKNMIQQKYGGTWQTTSDPNVQVLINGNTKYSARPFSSEGTPTIEYYRNNVKIGKFRFNP